LRGFKTGFLGAIGLGAIFAAGFGAMGCMEGVFCVLLEAGALAVAGLDKIGATSVMGLGAGAVVTIAGSAGATGATDTIGVAGCIGGEGRADHGVGAVTAGVTGAVRGALGTVPGIGVTVCSAAGVTVCSAADFCSVF